MTLYNSLLAGSIRSLVIVGSFMGSPFVKLNGVGALNVAERAARLFCPRRHANRCAVALSLGCLQFLARAGAGDLVRRGGVGFFFLHDGSFASSRKRINSAFSEARL